MLRTERANSSAPSKSCTYSASRPRTRRSRRARSFPSNRSTPGKTRKPRRDRPYVTGKNCVRSVRSSSRRRIPRTSVIAASASRSRDRSLTKWSNSPRSRLARYGMVELLIGTLACHTRAAGGLPATSAKASLSAVVWSHLGSNADPNPKDWMTNATVCTVAPVDLNGIPSSPS